MSYAEILKKSLDESGLKLTQISTKCASKGVKIDRTYISKLSNGVMPPAGEEINKVLAEILNIDYGILEYEAYMEKAPDRIKNFISKFLKFYKINFSKLAEKLMPKEMLELFRANLMNLHESAILDLFTKMPLDEMEKEIMNSEIINIEGKELIVPNLGFVKMPDRSMEPTIFYNEALQLDLTGEYRDTDIVMAHPNDKTKEVIIRRLLVKGKEVILRADNRRNRDIKFLKDEVKIVGRIKAVIKEL